MAKKKISYEYRVVTLLPKHNENIVSDSNQILTVTFSPRRFNAPIEHDIVLHDEDWEILSHSSEFPIFSYAPFGVSLLLRRVKKNPLKVASDEDLPEPV